MNRRQGELLKQAVQDVAVAVWGLGELISMLAFAGVLVLFGVYALVQAITG